jgi:CRP-like cAMP-binding protein
MDNRLEVLNSVRLFESLSNEEMGRVLESADDVGFDPASDIVREADESSDFYLLLSGEAAVWVRGRRRQTLRAGDYFGEMSVLDGGPRSASVRAEGPVRALRWDRSSFLSLLDEHGAIGRRLLEELSGRLRRAEEVLVHW